MAFKTLAVMAFALFSSLLRTWVLLTLSLSELHWPFGYQIENGSYPACFSSPNSPSFSCLRTFAHAVSFTNYLFSNPIPCTQWTNPHSLAPSSNNSSLRKTSLTPQEISNPSENQMPFVTFRIVFYIWLIIWMCFLKAETVSVFIIESPWLAEWLHFVFVQNICWMNDVSKTGFKYFFFLCESHTRCFLTISFHLRCSPDVWHDLLLSHPTLCPW